MIAGRQRMAAKKKRRSAFVPRLLVKTAMISVVPACAVGCGTSGTSPFVSDAASDAVSDAPVFGVGAVAYVGYEAGSTAEAGPVDASDDVFLGVAAVAYTGFEAGEPDGDAGPEPADARPDAFHGFVLAVTAYEVDVPRKG
jgi:hypothetical protein